jgi:S-adenosylmethionine:tRNA ribosyltransferase-isomerase
MKLHDFDYSLPKELIAQAPSVPRDQARLLVYNRRTKQIKHTLVADLPNIIPQKMILVSNNSKVRRARLRAQNTKGKQFEILTLKKLSTDTFRCVIGGHGLKLGSLLTLKDTSIQIQIKRIEDDPEMQTYILQFISPEAKSLANLEEILEEHGETPLPPYIKSPTASPEQYQTVFAKELGSAAAPTAGLHFTPELIKQLQNQGHIWREITLHVGLGTFSPLRFDDVERNTLHSEYTDITQETADLINAKTNPVLAIGTTTARTLESHTQSNRVLAGELETDLFIYPGYSFKTVRALMTNFHLPHSSLLLLIAAFLGNDQNGNVVLSEKGMTKALKDIYEEAVKEKYRFYSFGDAMLII